MSSRTRTILRNIARHNMKAVGIRRINRNMSSHWHKYIPTARTLRRKAAKK